MRKTHKTPKGYRQLKVGEIANEKDFFVAKTFKHDVTCWLASMRHWEPWTVKSNDYCAYYRKL